jgi:hypothetical protein
MKRFLLLSVFTCIYTMGFAQDFGYGFKAGLSFNRFLGPSEMDSQGAELEEMVNNTGFHVGAIFNLKFIKEFGARAEILYSQKGGRNRYDGPSFFTLYTVDSDEVQTTGNRKSSININASYVDIPIGVWYRPLNWLEFSAGGNIGILGGSSGAGQVTYSGISENGGNVPEFSITLEHDYYRNETGDASFGSGSNFIEVDGEQIELPSRSGAYYEFPRGEGSAYNPLDIGVYGGFSLFLNKGFFLGMRVNYGLTDVTNNNNDYSLLSKDSNGEPIPRDDVDRNFTIQTSLGFSF